MVVTCMLGGNSSILGSVCVTKVFGPTLTYYRYEGVRGVIFQEKKCYVTFVSQILFRDEIGVADNNSG